MTISKTLPPGFTQTFENTTDGGEFSGYHAARKFLQDHGYSLGEMCRDMPMGIMCGTDWMIAKWRNLTKREISELDGRLISINGGPRYGVTIVMTG